MLITLPARSDENATIHEVAASSMSLLSARGRQALSWKQVVTLNSQRNNFFRF